MSNIEKFEQHYEKNKHFEQHKENQAISITSFEQPEATFEQDKGNFEQYPEKSSNIKEIGKYRQSFEQQRRFTQLSDHFKQPWDKLKQHTKTFRTCIFICFSDLS